MTFILPQGLTEPSPLPLGGPCPELPPDLVSAAVRVLEERHRRLQEGRAALRAGPPRFGRDDPVEADDEPLWGPRRRYGPGERERPEWE